ncbi:hypothetical protein SAMN05421890_3171 [Ensifer adhaerens]|nr:hypothetical protein SAMN05421890_3171 [Ensifer adhaerens]
MSFHVVAGVNVTRLIHDRTKWFHIWTKRLKILIRRQNLENS